MGHPCFKQIRLCYGFTGKPKRTIAILGSPKNKSHPFSPFKPGLQEVTASVIQEGLPKDEPIEMGGIPLCHSGDKPRVIPLRMNTAKKQQNKLAKKSEESLFFAAPTKNEQNQTQTKSLPRTPPFEIEIDTL